MKNLKNTLLSMSMLMSTAIAVSMERPPQLPKMSLTSLEGLPTDLKRQILLINAQYDGVLNIPGLAKGILDLAATNKKLRTTINNPNNMLTIMKSLPKAGAIVLADKLRKMAGIENREVQKWLYSIKLENGKELFDAVGAAHPNHKIIASILANSNIDVNWKDTHGNTALIKRYGDIEIVRHLLNAGANVNAKNNDGWTALMVTSNPHIVRVLIAAGANVNAENNERRTALISASQNGDTEIVELLISAGANLDVRETKDFWTALMIATAEPRLGAIKLLLKAGASVDIQNSNGWTALMFAIARKSPEIVQLLLEAGANPTHKDLYGKSVMDLARYHKNLAFTATDEAKCNVIIKLLEDAERRLQQNYNQKLR